MQENEFERQVRRLMGEFHLSPSESVWKKVEQQINRDKRRSRWLIIPLLLSVLTLAGYFTYQALHHANNNMKQNIAVQESKKDIAANKSVQQKSSDAISSEKTQPTIAPQQNSITLKQLNDRTQSKRLADTKNIASQNSLAETENFSSPLLIHKNDAGIDNKKTMQPVAGTVAKDQAITGEKIQNEKIMQSFPGENKIANNTSAAEQFSETKIKNATDSLPVTLTENKKPNAGNQKTKKWQWGINAFYGRSDVLGNLLGIHFFQNSGMQDYLNNSGNQADSASMKTSNLIKASSAFKLGVLMQKEISKRSSISFGVNYMLLHTKTEAGKLVDSAINVNVPGLSDNLNVINYYKPGSENFINNAYHFIEVPVMFQHRFNNSKKIPLYYNAGISLARLIAAHSLFYDRYNNIFYSETDLFRKTQLHLQFGLNTSFKVKGNTSIYIGPQVQYSLSNLLNNKNYGNQHLFNWGLQANIVFHKK